MSESRDADKDLEPWGQWHKKIQCKLSAETPFKRGTEHIYYQEQGKKLKFFEFLVVPTVA